LLQCSCSLNSSTTPNIAFYGRYPRFFSVIKNNNPLLAKELAKLPELQDGISSEEAAALKILVDAYRKNTAGINDVFQKINGVGIPSVRKYCSPLQALFWLAEDGNVKELEQQITNYKLNSLLNACWSYYKGKNRWTDSHVIIDRLNSPRLFEYWFKRNFTYDWSKFYITAQTALPKRPVDTISSRKGICFDAAHLAVTCLERAGYDVTGLNVYFAGRSRESAVMHSVCLLRIKQSEKTVYYKLADTNGPHPKRGPFESIKEIASAVAANNGAPLGKFVTGMPSLDMSHY
jgi:hypothetical protein